LGCSSSSKPSCSSLHRYAYLVLGPSRFGNPTKRREHPTHLRQRSLYLNRASRCINVYEKRWNDQYRYIVQGNLATLFCFNDVVIIRLYPCRVFQARGFHEPRRQTAGAVYWFFMSGCSPEANAMQGEHGIPNLSFVRQRPPAGIASHPQKQVQSALDNRALPLLFFSCYLSRL